MIIISLRLLKDNFFHVVAKHIDDLSNELNIDSTEMVKELSTIQDLNRFMSIVNEHFKGYLKLIM